jgi:hypothetical protein
MELFDVDPWGVVFINGTDVACGRGKDKKEEFVAALERWRRMLLDA